MLGLLLVDPKEKGKKMAFTLVKGAGSAKPSTEPLGQAAWTDGPQNTLTTIKAFRNMVSRLQERDTLQGQMPPMKDKGRLQTIQSLVC